MKPILFLTCKRTTDLSFANYYDFSNYEPESLLLVSLSTIVGDSTEEKKKKQKKKEKKQGLVREGTWLA